METGCVIRSSRLDRCGDADGGAIMMRITMGDTGTVFNGILQLRDRAI